MATFDLYRYSFSTLRSIICIADKYGAEEVLQAAIARLDPLLTVARLSSTSQEWGWWTGEASTNITLTRIGVEIKPEDAFEVLNLARRINKPEWLPLALFICCTGDRTALRDGLVREDGSVERLTKEDYERCIAAMPRLAEAYRKAMVKTFNYSVRSNNLCILFLGCDNRVQKLLQDFETESLPQLILSPSLFSFGEFDKGEMCTNCSNALRRYGAQCCEAAFHELPSYFSLDIKVDN